MAKSYSKMYWVFVELTKFGILGFWAASSLPTAFASMSWDVCTKDEYVYFFLLSRWSFCNILASAFCPRNGAYKPGSSVYSMMVFPRN